MPSIRDIIENATPGPWMESHGMDYRAAVYTHHYGGGPHVIARSDIREAAFIATFDPEHIALMEAYIQVNLRQEDCNNRRFTGFSYDDWVKESEEIVADYIVAEKALLTYRKEHGYDA